MTEVELESILNQIQYCEKQFDVINNKINHSIKIRDNTDNPEIKRIYRRYVKKLEKLKQIHIDAIFDLKLLWHRIL